MLAPLAKLRRIAFAIAIGASLGLSSVVSAATNPWTSSAPTWQAAAGPVPGLLEANDQNWTPEALEDLLAPVARYPDEFVGHVLVAATSLRNCSTPPRSGPASCPGPHAPPESDDTRHDVLGARLDAELGQAYVNDQAGVLAAVQRLRRRARDSGNLQTSENMLVETVAKGGEQAIAFTSRDPNVAHVPQYDVEKV